MLTGDHPDVFRYDSIPENLRVQIIQIWHRTFGYSVSWPDYNNPIAEIVEFLCHENGVFKLLPQESSSLYPETLDEELARYFLFLSEVDEVLDVINVICYNDHRIQNPSVHSMQLKS